MSKEQMSLSRLLTLSRRVENAMETRPYKEYEEAKEDLKEGFIEFRKALENDLDMLLALKGEEGVHRASMNTKGVSRYSAEVKTRRAEFLKRFGMED